MEKIIALVGAGVISFLLVMVEHYLPWRGILRKDLPRLQAYILGTLAMAVPFGVMIALFPLWERFEIILYFCIVVVSAGLGTFLSYHLDHLVSTRNRADESEEREKALLTEVKQ